MESDKGKGSNNEPRWLNEFTVVLSIFNVILFTSMLDGIPDKLLSATLLTKEPVELIIGTDGINCCNASPIGAPVCKINVLKNYLKIMFPVQISCNYNNFILFLNSYLVRDFRIYWLNWN